MTAADPHIRRAAVADYQRGGESLAVVAARYDIPRSTLGAWVGKKVRIPKPCTVEGCENKHLARGYCRRHYGNFVLGQTPQPSRRIELEDIEWMAETGECWSRAAARLGVKPNTLQRKLEREGRYDLISALRRREVAL
jgi:transposase-like protein